MRPRKRLTELLVKAALETNPVMKSRTFHPRFLRSPLSFLGDSRVTGVELGINSLEGNDLENQQAVPTGAKEILNGGLVLRSIGYRSVCADGSIPFDTKKGKTINVRGRVEKGTMESIIFPHICYQDFSLETLTLPLKLSVRSHSA